MGMKMRKEHKPERCKTMQNANQCKPIPVHELDFWGRWDYSVVFVFKDVINFGSMEGEGEERTKRKEKPF